MTVAACLLLYGVVAALVFPPVVSRVTRGGLAPRLGAAAWLVAIGSVLGSWLLAIGLLVAELARQWANPGSAVWSCLALLGEVLAGRHGAQALAVLMALAGLAVFVTGRLAVRLGAILRRGQRRADRHREMAHLVGRHVPGVEAVVVDVPEPAAYCLPGRPRTVVVTSAALNLLDSDQLAAVLAHERAHLTGRHHAVQAITQGLAAVLPGLRLFTVGAAEVAQLLEMSADDTAARRHGRDSLIGALLALTAPAAPPVTALAATGSTVGARAQRLLHPPRPAHRALSRLVLTLTLAMLLAGPVVATVLPEMGRGLCRLPFG